jgi:hypothetical protein
MVGPEPELAGFLVAVGGDQPADIHVQLLSVSMH